VRLFLGAYFRRGIATRRRFSRQRVTTQMSQFDRLYIV
jgi:hypothetical protein